MRVERRPDGTLCLGESLRLLRWGCVLGALGVAAGAGAVALGLVEARLAGREWVVLGGIALACVAGALWAPTTQIEIEPGRARIHWRRARLLGGRERSIPFASVLGVEVIEHRSRRDDGGPAASHCVVLLTADQRIPLSVVDLDADEAEALAREVRRIVGPARAAERGGDERYPAEGDLEARVRAHVAAGRGVEAVALVRAERGLSLEDADRWVRGMIAPSRGRS